MFGRQRNSEYLFTLSPWTVSHFNMLFYQLKNKQALSFCCCCHFYVIHLFILYVFLCYWRIGDLQWLSWIAVIQLYIYMCVYEYIYIYYIYIFLDSLPLRLSLSSFSSISQTNFFRVICTCCLLTSSPQPTPVCLPVLTMSLKRLF